jgi:hypothetical protein
LRPASIKSDLQVFAEPSFDPSKHQEAAGKRPGSTRITCILGGIIADR